MADSIMGNIDVSYSDYAAGPVRMIESVTGEFERVTKVYYSLDETNTHDTIYLPAKNILYFIEYRHDTNGDLAQTRCRIGKPQNLAFSYNLKAYCAGGVSFTCSIDETIFDSYDFGYAKKLLDASEIKSRLGISEAAVIEKIEISCSAPGVVVYKDLSDNIWAYPTVFTNTCAVPVTFEYTINAAINGTYTVTRTGTGAICGYKPKRITADVVALCMKDKVDAVIAEAGLIGATVVYSVETSSTDVTLAAVPADGNAPVIASTVNDTLKPIQY
jgi:hypothetical protein